MVAPVIHTPDACSLVLLQRMEALTPEVMHGAVWQEKYSRIETRPDR